MIAVECGPRARSEKAMASTTRRSKKAKESTESVGNGKVTGVLKLRQEREFALDSSVDTSASSFDPLDNV